MNINKFFKMAAIPALVMALSACGGKRGTLDLNFVSTAALSITSTHQLLTTFTDPTITHLLTGEDSGLISYKVYFRKIEVCNSLTPAGSGYSGATGCAILYNNESADAYTGMADPTAAHYATFLAATEAEGKYFDLLNPIDLAALKAKMTTEIAVGSYSWGLMETHPWVVIKAKAGTLCTKSGGTFEADGQFNSYVKVADLSCDDGAEEALVYMTNGNSSFKFATPLVVGEGQSVRADIVFNLDRNIIATTQATGDIRAEDETGGFEVPMFNASPVIMGSTDKLVKESYAFTVTGFSSMTGTQLFIDLYYPSTDTTETPIAVTGSFVRGDTVTQGASQKFDEIQVTDGTVKLLDWRGGVPVTFTRTAAGVASTGTITCGSGAEDAYFSGCDAEATEATEGALSDADGPTITEVE